MELKEEIISLVQEIPKEKLDEVLKILRSYTISNNEKITFSNNLERVLSEDRELLIKLAK